MAMKLCAAAKHYYDPALCADCPYCGDAGSLKAAAPLSDGLTAVLRSPEQAQDPFYTQAGLHTATADVLDAQACAAVERERAGVVAR